MARKRIRHLRVAGPEDMPAKIQEGISPEEIGNFALHMVPDGPAEERFSAQSLEDRTIENLRQELADCLKELADTYDFKSAKDVVFAKLHRSASFLVEIPDGTYTGVERFVANIIKDYKESAPLEYSHEVMRDQSALELLGEAFVHIVESPKIQSVEQALNDGFVQYYASPAWKDIKIFALARRVIEQSYELTSRLQRQASRETLYSPSTLIKSMGIAFIDKGTTIYVPKLNEDDFELLQEKYCIEIKQAAERAWETWP